MLVVNLEWHLVVNAKNPCKLSVYKGFCGPDGTRTRDLRRDRPAF